MPKSQDTPLRLMIVDDSPEAAEAIVSALRNAGMALRPLRPASADEFTAMLAAQPVDVVVAQLDSAVLPLATVLQQVTATGKDMPVLVVADALEQAAYVQAMTAGARAMALREPSALLVALVRDAGSAHGTDACRHRCWKASSRTTWHSSCAASSSVTVTISRCRQSSPA